MIFSKNYSIDLLNEQPHLTVYIISYPQNKVNGGMFPRKSVLEWAFIYKFFHIHTTRTSCIHTTAPNTIPPYTPSNLPEKGHYTHRTIILSIHIVNTPSRPFYEVTQEKESNKEREYIIFTHYVRKYKIMVIYYMYYTPYILYTIIYIILYILYYIIYYILLYIIYYIIYV